ncbi:biotin transporter BioY [Acidimangrovimonas sediminis]|uniref:biotin transporter BioY n=1 Tax=Acidimangrovimonas sediminis TaxID=2056283 RepID=UPI000C809915|nr:biotin transporter BioY [Acidimangrovimonas sediminis]
MALAASHKVLAEKLLPAEGSALRLKQVALVAGGVAAMIVAAKIRVPMWPVNATMQTFVVLTIGAAYGMRLGLLSMLGYLALGALGFGVFTGQGAGLGYMLGATGGYLVGFAAAAGVMGVLARRGWDRSFGTMALSMAIGLALIYGFGLAWMAVLFADKGAAWVLQYGLVNFLPFEVAKVALAALLFPAAWRLVGRARG